MGYARECLCGPSHIGDEEFDSAMLSGSFYFRAMSSFVRRNNCSHPTFLPRRDMTDTSDACKIIVLPTFRSFFGNLGGKPFYTVELFKSSILSIRSTRDFAKNANANCGMWAYVSHLCIISFSTCSCALYALSPNNTMSTCCRLVGF